MTAEKNIPLYIVLTIITCGLFGIYWLYALGSDIKRLNQSNEPESPGLYVFLSIITCGIFLIYLFYQYPKYIADIQEQRQQKVNDISIVTLVITLAPLISGCAIAPVGYVVNLALIQGEVNKIVASKP